jgi:hypothetical protein
VLRQDKHNHLGGVDCVNDRVGTEVAGHHIPWRDPAGHALSFQRATNGVRDSDIRRGVTDKYIGRAGMSTQGFRRSSSGASGLFPAAALGHVEHPPLVVRNGRGCSPGWQLAGTSGSRNDNHLAGLRAVPFDTAG